MTGYSVQAKRQPLESLVVRSVQCSSVPCTPVRNVLTLLYGYRAISQTLTRIQRSLDQTQVLYEFVAEVDVGKIDIGRLTLRSLQDVRMMHMGRLDNDVDECVKSYWRRYLREEGCSEFWIEQNVTLAGFDYTAGRVDLLARLVKEPEFRHLAVIVHLAPGPKALGSIFDRGAIRDLYCKNNRAVEVVIDPA